MISINRQNTCAPSTVNMLEKKEKEISQGIPIFIPKLHKQVEPNMMRTIIFHVPS